MSKIIYKCEIDLDLSNSNSQKVENMSDMFYKCEKLILLDLSSFNTINVTNMNNNMFSF